MARTADPNRKTDHTAGGRPGVLPARDTRPHRMIEVAEAAAVGKGTIYEYFRSKEELFFAVFEEMMHEAGAVPFPGWPGTWTGPSVSA
jgi:hypothetical protein